MNELTMINIDELYPHPDNPRKNIGDIEELTKSIKANGLMQNLTVIPGHYSDDNLEDGGYTIIIGHRRFAAANAAGLTEVPCHIVDLSYKEQITTMLEENMQRNDLTICEQAEGFQMMMDLGETEQDLVEKTGFSKTTIRHRLNLAKLDLNVLQEKEQDEGFQLSFTDLYELEKIKNIDTRNQILCNSDTPYNMRWMIRQKIREEEIEQAFSKIIKVVEEYGIKEGDKNNDGYYKWEFNIDVDEPDYKELNNIDKDLVDNYVWRRYYNELSIYQIMDKDESESQEEVDEEKIRREANKKTFTNITNALQDKVKTFIDNVIAGNLKNEPSIELYDEMLNIILKGTTAFKEDVIIGYLLGKSRYCLTTEDKKDGLKAIKDMSMLNKILIVFADKISEFKFIREYNGKCDKQHANEIKQIFEIYSKWGFSLEEDEERLLDGTSELYEDN